PGHRRGQDYLHVAPPYREFQRRREGMRFALNGGVWLHRHKIHDEPMVHLDRKSTRLNSSHVAISYAVFCLKKKNMSSKMESAKEGNRTPKPLRAEDFESSASATSATSAGSV